MHDNKAFATWATLVIAGSAALVMFIVQVLGAQLPPFSTIAEHVAMGLCVRAAYKYTGGFDWADWSIAGDPVDVVAAEEGVHAHPGATAGAMG